MAELVWEQVRDWLVTASNYWLATVRPDGRPHLAPVWGVWFDDALWWSTGPASVKGRNLASGRPVAVHTEQPGIAVIAEGTAAPVHGPVPGAANAAYTAKYGQLDGGEPFTLDMLPPQEGGVWRLAPARVQAWREADFPDSTGTWTRAGSTWAAGGRG